MASTPRQEKFELPVKRGKKNGTDGKARGNKMKNNYQSVVGSSIFFV